MKLLEMLTNPIVLLFAISVLGHYIGKIKIANISLDISGVLIMAVIIGYIIQKTVPVNLSFSSDMALVSKLGTSMFVGSIGLHTGITMQRTQNKEQLKCVFLGVFATCIGFAIIKIIEFLDSSISRSTLLGILCGALTSTPGLSTVCESETISPEHAVVGYSSAYVFGVVGVVFFVQLLSNKCKVKESYEIKSNKNILLATGSEALIPLGISVFIGQILGSLEIPCLGISLGSSGGILVIGIIIGLIMQLRKKEMFWFGESIKIYRNLGLIMFFVGAGVPAGMKINNAFSVKWFLYGVVITAITMMLLYAASFFLLGRSVNNALCVVSGGMTSTPAIGVLLRKKDLSFDLQIYSMVYTGALFTMVFIASFFT